MIAIITIIVFIGSFTPFSESVSAASLSLPTYPDGDNKNIHYFFGFGYHEIWQRTNGQWTSDGDHQMDIKDIFYKSRSGESYDDYLLKMVLENTFTAVKVSSSESGVETDGGSRIIKKHEYIGIVANGRKYFYSRKSCTSNFDTVETFTSPKAAANNGYIPLDCTVGYRK